jgi:hypothetical protein
MSDQIIQYSSVQTIFNQRLQTRKEPKTYTVDNINTFQINNPYFKNVGEIVDKFGPSSPYYNINFSVRVYGTIGFEERCWDDVLLYLNDDLFYRRKPYTEFEVPNQIRLDESYFEKTISSTNQKTFVFKIDFLEDTNSDGVNPKRCDYVSYILMNIEFKYSGQIFIGNFCTEKFFDPVCLNFCNDPSNTVLCVNQSLSWCFNNPTQPEFSRFFQTPNCKTFIKNYISENVSHSQYDKKFKEICKKLEVDGSNYKNFTNGIDPSFDLDIKNICACNLDDSIYNNFYDTFATEIPSIRAANFGSKKCIFPECNTSEYKPTEILGYNVCPRIDCINISQIDNNGRIIGGLTLNQNTNCPNIEDPRRPCNQDGDCGVGKKCLQGICVEENVCRINTNCSADTKCFNNICVRDDYCSKDSDCVDGLKCSKNICVKDIANTNNLTIIIFIAIITILVIFFAIILLIYFIKRSKKN